MDRFKQHDCVRFTQAGKTFVGNIEFRSRDHDDSWSVFVVGHGRMIVPTSTMEPWHEPGGG